MSNTLPQQATDRLAATLLALALKVKELKSVDDLKNFASKNEFEAQAQDGQLGTYEYGGHPIILLKYAGVVHEFVDREMISGWLDKKVQISPGTGSTGTEAQNKVLVKIGEHVYATSLDQLQDFIDLDNAVVNNQMAISGNKAQIALLKAFARYLGTITGTNATDISKAPATRPDGTAFQEGDYIILKYGLPVSNPGDTVKYVFQEFVWETDKFVPLGEAQEAHPHASPGFLLKEIKDTPTYAAGADASAIGSINIDRTKFNEIKDKDNVILDLDVSGITPKDNSQFYVIQDDDATFERVKFSSGDIASWDEVKDKINTHSMLLEKDGSVYYIRGWVLKPKASIGGKWRPLQESDIVQVGPYFKLKNPLIDVKLKVLNKFYFPTMIDIPTGGTDEVVCYDGTTRDFYKWTASKNNWQVEQNIYNNPNAKYYPAGGGATPASIWVKE